MADNPAAPVAAVEAEIAAVEEELETAQPGSAEWRELTSEIKGLRSDLRELLTKPATPEPPPPASPQTPAPAPTPTPEPEAEIEQVAVLRVAAPGASSPAEPAADESNPPKGSKRPRKRRLKLW